MKNGFTLIELLAVIVILAIIALIAVPIVLNIINESKESSLLRSAEFYLDAVEYTIADAFLYHGGLEDKEYPITPNGDICKVALVNNECSEENTLKVEVSGDKPAGGFITVNGGTISDVSLILDDRTIIKNSEGELAYAICTLISGDKNTPGSKYECEVKPGTKHNFYVLSQESDGTTNLIMERNICSDGTVATEQNKCPVAWDDSYEYNNGPVTAMEYLNEATSTWSNIDNLDITHDDESGYFENFQLTGKARLPYLSEVDGHDSSNTYLYDYLSYREDSSVEQKQQNPIEGIVGYLIFDLHPVRMEFVFCPGGYVDTSCGNGTYGVRPVINIKL